MNTLSTPSFNRSLLYSLSFSFICVITGLVLSYSAIFFVEVIVISGYIVLSVVKKSTIHLLYSMILSTFFDVNDVFTFGGELMLRPWYVISVSIGVFLFLKSLKDGSFLNVKRANSGIWSFFLVLIFLFIFSFVVNDYKKDAGLFIVKIILFYLPLIVSFVALTDWEDLNLCLHYWMFMILSVSIFSLIQLFNLLYGSGVLTFDKYEGSPWPHGFFSERTWLGYMGCVGIILSFYFYRVFKAKKYLIMAIPSFLIVLISVTRGAYLALSGSLLLLFFTGKLKRIAVDFTWFFIAILASIFIAAFYADKYDFSLIDIMLARFNLEDDSATGRLEAYRQSIDTLKGINFFTGVGFGYSEMTELSKSTIGSKSFNFFLAIFSSFGFFGFLWLLTCLIMFILGYLKNLFVYRKHNYEMYFLIMQCGLALFSSFILYAQNAPLHLHPMGWLVLSMTLSIYFNREEI
ncbi:MAG: hypothetical protein UT02_C0055G0007 [Parcubacteria group bacterium GW2011_GWC2_38_7]|nr:MAG: hypothetical protein UT02_C0055G0007 [Parcubacteria group bacterium GW2011_GWC2_38_7]